MASEKVITRIAPSPTGHLHIGTARTALFNYLFAKKHGGTFIVRSEDTDRARSTKEFEAEILEGLEWLGLQSDAFYRQSERTDIYKNFLETLVEQDRAYISKEISKAEPGVMVELVRLRNSNTVVTFNDMVRGDISVDTTELGDFVIARSLTDPLYHFTVVVDDHMAGVSHVIRGEDHISNTPRQILIQEAIGASRPLYAHLPLILSADRSKLSKRHGAVSLTEYRASGFTAEAIVNYLALLGWNPGTEEEIFSLEELCQKFELSHIQKGGAVFDMVKFTWFNKEHLKRLSDIEYLKIAYVWLPESARGHSDADGVLLRMLPLLRERISTLGEITSEILDGELTFAFFDVAPSRELLKWKKDTDASDSLPRLIKVAELLSSNLNEYPTAEEVKAALWDYAETAGRGEVLWPLRVALSGRERSPDPFSAIAILGLTESQKRIKNACDTIKSA